MARKDVDLVIRAKDEAAKVVDSITSAINNFVDAQKDLAGSAGKTQTILGSLGAALGNLDRELKGLSVSDKISSQFDKATAATQRLEKEFEEMQDASRKMAQDLQRAEQAADRYKSKAEGAAAAQQKQSAALKAAQASQRDFTNELRKANAERDRLQATDSRLSQSLAKQEDAVAKAAERYNKLAQEIAKTSAPSATLKTRMESATASLEKQTSKLTQLREKYATTQAGIAEVGNRIQDLGQKLNGANVAVAKQEGVVAKINDNYRMLSAASKTAGQNLKSTADASDRAADALERQAGRIDRAKNELTQLATAAGKADAAMAELAARSGQALNKAFATQRRTMLETKREWLSSTDAARQMANEIGRVGVPTQKMAETLDRTRDTAARSKREYLALRDGVQELSGVMRRSATDVESLRAKQIAFANSQQQTANALTRIRSEAQVASSGYRTLVNEVSRAGEQTRRTSDAIRSSAGASGSAANANNRLADAYKRIYGESRLAMSWTQRLRGEVLSLVTAYGGIYGVIGLLNKTVDAFVTLEGVTNRLNAAFGGNKNQAADELDWIRRNAERLGIAMSVLGDEYSKFAVAAKASNFENKATRDIFLAVAEAGRVNKLSMENMSGVFLALQQMISKGKVSSEELRRQMGDRLPGAFNIFASAIGKTAAELDDMMRKGEVFADQETMLKFADELNKRYGPTLSSSLTTTTTELGRLGDAAFKALVKFGEAGFIESFTNLVRQLNETLRSSEFESFAAKASKAFGLLVDVLALVVKNFRLVLVAGTAFAGLKLAPLILALVSNFGTLGNTAQRVGTIMGATQRTMVAATATTRGLETATVAASTAMRGFGLALRTILSSTGIGLAVTAVAAGIGLWATRTDSATAALNAHEKIVDTVKNTYDKVGESAAKWAEEIQKISMTQAVANFQNFQQEVEKAKTGLSGFVLMLDQASGGLGGNQKAIDDIARMVREAKAGERSLDDLKKRIDEIAQANPGLDRGIILQLLNAIDAAGDFEDKMKAADAVIKLIIDPADEAAKAVLGLGQNFETEADKAAQATAASAKFQEALTGIGEAVDKINKSFDLMVGQEKLDEAFAAAAKAATNMKELNQAIDEYNSKTSEMYSKYANQQFGSYDNGVAASAALLRDRERFKEQAYPDMTYRNGQYVNSGWRAGFGSDTIQLADGTIKKITEGMRVSVEDANRDLNRRIGEFQAAIKDRIGADRFGSFNPQQQAALTSIAYNYGSLPERIIGAVKTGTDAQIAQAIRGLANDNQGINRERRNLEAGLFEGGANIEDIAKRQEAADKKRTEELEKQKKSTQETIAANQQAISQQELINAGKGREAAIEKAIAEAKKDNPNITAAEIEQIRQQTGALYELQQVKKLDKDQEKEAAAQMQLINSLLAQRTELEKTLNFARKEGDNEKVQETTTKIQEVNTALTEAIAKAREMWAAIGGPAADTAAIKLDTAAAKAANLAAKAQQNVIDWQRVGNLFASGLTNAFDNFAQAVANGTSIGEAARDAFLQFAADFLRQIAQMIIQQAILNALRGFFPGFFGAGAGHTGGLIGSSLVGGGNMRRGVDPGVFAGATRYHTGGIIGLAPNEVPIIGKKGEEVITKTDPRHMLNGGGSSGSAPAQKQDLTIVNTLDSGDFVSRGMQTNKGRAAVINFIRDNASVIRQEIGL